MGKSKLGRGKGDVPPGISFEYGGQVYRDAFESLAIEKSDDVTPERVRQLLGLAPGKFSYWSAVAADIGNALRQTQDRFEVWLASKQAEQKKEQGDQKYVSEKSKMYTIMTTYPKAYAGFLSEIRALETSHEKANVLVKSYEMQSRTLQTVAALLRQELQIQGQA